MNWNLIKATTIVWWFWVKHQNHQGFEKVEKQDMYGFYCRLHEKGMVLR